MAIESLVALGLATALLAGLAWYASRQARSERKIKAGRVETERLERIALIENYAEKVFGDAGMARDWMTSNNAAMDATPLSMLDTETGAVEVRKILSAIAYGGAS